MARLPQPGGDDQQWGTILNTFLSVEHNADGTAKIRTDGSVAPLSSGKVPVANLGSGTASPSNFLRGDGVWAVPPTGSGSSTLAGNSDVTISSPSGGQALLYDGGTSKWLNQSLPAAPVSSVAGRTGAISLTKTDVGLANVDNTADTAKIVASAAKLTTARTINGVSFDGTANITVADSTKVPATRTVNGKALSADITIATADISGLQTALDGRPVRVLYSSGWPTRPSATYVEWVDATGGAAVPSAMVDGDTFVQKAL